VKGGDDEVRVAGDPGEGKCLAVTLELFCRSRDAFIVPEECDAAVPPRDQVIDRRPDPFPVLRGHGVRID
jgi:hypothetical protein